MKYNRICQILGIEKPVIQGPLSWLTDARLVAAVSNAGGLGVLGPNAGLTAETAVSTPEETAEGVFAGSVFIGTEESRVPQSVKDKIINANGLDLLLFRTLPDYYRSLPGKLADKLVSMDKAGASNEELAQTMGGLRGLRIGMLEGNTDEGYIALGTGIGNIRSIKSVAEVVNELTIC
ncbi:2-nitropropane dioxygenase [Salmonella enterica subsp. enterica serovar Worthington]|nr:2-nitropropane dioxygenase [Salmonella enterica subsp. enterica serovar Worthington]